MRGAGAAPLRRSGRQPRRDRTSIKKGKRRSRSFRADACIRNGNGRFAHSHRIAPAETGQGAMPLARCRGRAPAQVWAAAQAQRNKHQKRKRRSASFRADARIRNGNGRFHGLASERLRLLCRDLIRPRCARPPSPKGKALRRESIQTLCQPDE